MPKSCWAPRCSNAAGQTRGSERRLSFYRFPLQDTPRLRRWLAEMQLEHWVPSQHQHLCSDHFQPHCFQYRWGVRYLRPDAVPTIFPRPQNPTVTRRRIVQSLKKELNITTQLDSSISSNSTQRKGTNTLTKCF